MTQQRNDHGDDSPMSYCFWATVKVLTIYLRILFFAWISALMPPNQVYHSFSHKKCINQCCNSVCRKENVVRYMPRWWQFKGLPNNLLSWGRNQRMFYGLKSSKRSFSKYLWKKLIDICAHWFFCTKFNSQQLLFEQFFDIIDNFRSVQPESESTFPFQYSIMFSDVLVYSLINENFLL